MKSEEIFEFNLSQTNRIRPKQLDKINVKNMIKKREYDKLNNVIDDLSQENFEENDYFELKKDEKKGLKTYQLLTQYLVYSINHLKKKQDIVNDLHTKQRVYNETADKIIAKQNKKIKEMELVNNNLNNNCASMEYLMKHMNLDDVILKLGTSNSINQKITHKKKIQDDDVDYSSDDNNQ